MGSRFRSSRGFFICGSRSEIRPPGRLQAALFAQSPSIDKEKGMIIVMKQGAGKEELTEVKKRIRELGYKAHVIHGETRNVIGAVGDERGKSVLQSLESMPGVDKVVPILKPYKLASREVKPEPSVFEIGPGLTIGGGVPGGDGRPLLGGERRADPGDGPRRQGGRGDGPAGRRLQAAHQPVQLSGDGGGGPQAAGPGPAGDGSADHHRGGESAGRGSGGPLCRHHAGRGPQHSELSPSSRCWGGSTSRSCSSGGWPAPSRSS